MSRVGDNGVGQIRRPLDRCVDRGPTSRSSPSKDLVVSPLIPYPQCAALRRLRLRVRTQTCDGGKSGIDDSPIDGREVSFSNGVVRECVSSRARFLVDDGDG